MSKENKSNQKGQRDRPYNFMLAQQVKYLKPPYGTLDKLLERLKEIGAERYAGILHDKDSGKTRISTYSCIFPMGERLNPLPKS